MASQALSAASLTHTCLCRAISYTPSFKHNELPLPSEFCHCDTCRRTSGAIAGAFVELAETPPSGILDQCTEYKSSEKVSRFFCPLCGSHIFLRGWSEGSSNLWFAWAGCLERADDDDRKDVDTIKVTMQCFVSDTMDGGLVGRMAEVATQKMSSSVTDDGDVPHMTAVYSDIWFGTKMTNADVQALAAESRTKEPKTDKLLAQCHCGSVQFYITRPDQIESYDEKTHRYFKDNNTKYLARICACRSCRSATGNPLHTWTYIPPKNIVTTAGEPVDFFEGTNGLEKLGSGIKTYRTSAEVTWSFCETCGATIFYEATDRSWVVDVSIGIIRSEVGAMACDFLEWDWEQVSNKDECRVQSLLDSVAS